MYSKVQNVDQTTETVTVCCTELYLSLWVHRVTFESSEQNYCADISGVALYSMRHTAVYLISGNLNHYVTANVCVIVCYSSYSTLNSKKWSVITLPEIFWLLAVNCARSGVSQLQKEQKLVCRDDVIVSDESDVMLT